MDIGAVGIAGDSSYDTTTNAYHIKGAGMGLGSTADAFHFAYYQIVQGDGQIVVRLSSADALAQAALVVRDTLDANAASAAVAVRAGSAQFVRRLATGNDSVIGAASAASVPCWLKLVRSGSTVSAFMSADGQTWTSLGSDTVDLGTLNICAGLAVSNGAPNPTSTAMASFDTIQSTFLPNQGLLLWLKADAGLTQDSNHALSLWADQSGNENDAVQATASQQPLVVTNAIGGQAAIRFDGTSSFLQLPAGFSDFTQGFTAFVITQPASTAPWQRFFDIGNGAGSDNLLLARNSSSNDLIYDAFNGGGLATSLDGPGILALNACQLLEVVHGPNGTVTMYKNGAQVAQGGASPINNITRTSGLIGKSNWNDSMFQGDIAEVVLFDEALTDADRQVWESYLNGKYQFNPPPATPTNLIAVPFSTSQIALSWGGSNDGATSYVVERQSIDGSWSTIDSTPVGVPGFVDSGLSANSQYSYRVTSTNSAGRSNASSPVSATTFSSGPDLPTNNLNLWLRADQGINEDSNGLVGAWADLSGHGNTVSQSDVTKQPQWINGTINGQPVLRFDGSQDCLSAVAPVVPLAGGATILAMVRLPDTSTHGPFVKIGDSNGVAVGVGGGSLDDNGDNAIGLYENVRWIGTGQPLGTRPALVEMTINPDGSASFSSDGVSLGSFVGGGPNAPSGTTGIGGYSYGSRYFRGDIAEVLVFDQPISSAERQAWSNYLNAKYQYAPPPSAPTQVQLTPLSTTQIEVTWTESTPGVTGSSVERQNSDGSWSLIGNVGAGVTTYVDSGLTAGLVYVYRISAANAGGSSPESDNATGATSSAGDVTTFPVAGLQLWLRADAGITADANEGVNSWIDQWGGYKAAQNTSTSEPVIVADDLNGQPAVRFNGSSDYLNSNFVGMGGSGLTFFVVTKGPQYQSLLRFQPYGSSSYLVYPWGAGEVFIDSADGATGAGVATGLASNQWNIGELTYRSGDQVTTFCNGIEVASRAAANVDLPGGLPLDIGYVAGGNEYAQADLAEVLIYSRSLNDAERQAVETYLNGKYAIVAAPGTPSNLSATAISNTQINLFWQPATSGGTPTSFSVERKVTGGSDDFVEVAAIAGDQISAFIDENLVGGSSYTYRVRGSNVAGYSGYSAETEVSVPTSGMSASSLPAVDSLILWLKPDAGVTKDAAGLVSSWTDASGHGENATQTSAPNQPLAVAGAIHGQPVIRFDGNSSYLRLPPGFSDFTQGATALVMTTPTVLNPWERIFELANGPSVDSIVFCRSSSSDDLLFQCVNGNGNLVTNITSGDGTITLGTPQLLEFSQNPNSGTGTLFKNGRTLISQSAGPFANVERMSNFVGYSNFNSGLFAGDIAEIVLFNRTLTDAERQAWENYLNAKYQFNPPPAAPVQVGVNILSDNQIALFWSESGANVSNYTVERLNQDGTWAVLATLGGSADNYVDADLTANTAYTYRVIANNASGSSPSAPFSGQTRAAGASFPTNGIRVWLHGDAGVSLDNNGGVSSWSSQVPGNQDANQSSSANRPRLVQNAVDGHSVVHFDGESSFLQLPSTLMTGATAAETFIVLRAADPLTGTTRGLWEFSPGSNFGAGTFYPDDQGNLFDIFGSNTRYGPMTSPLALDQFNLYDVSAAPNAWMARLDGQVLASNQTNVVDFSPCNVMLGAANGGMPFLGDIAELIVFDHTLSPADHQTVEQYLAAKYTLQPTPPAPVALTSVGLSPGQVSLAWNCAANNVATRFNVERELADSNDYQVVATVNNTTSFLDSTVNAGTTYSYRVAAVGLTGAKSSYSNESDAVTPTVGFDMPLTGMRLWLKAGAGSTGPIDDWVDQSGNGNDAQQSLGANQPVVLYDAFTHDLSHPVVRFSGNSFLQLPSTLMTGATAAEAFIVLRAADPLTGTTRGLWEFSPGSNYGAGTFYPDYQGNIFDIFGSNTRYGPMTSPLALDQFNLYDVSAATNAWTARLDGQVLASNQNNVVDFSPCNVMLGAANGGVPFLGDIAELIVFDHTLSDSERLAVQRYFTVAYAIGGFIGGLADADDDGDGISNYQEYLNGTDPFDYYNGQTPRIAITSGDNQLGSAGAFVAQPLTAKVTDASGAPLVNAPVVFTITRSTGLLADPAASNTLSSTITVRTGADGNAAALFQAPAGTLLFTSLVRATAGTANRTNQVTFVEAIVASDDTSGDGLPDGWKLQHGLDLLSNDAAGDPDGDGLTNLQEYYLGTDPNTANLSPDEVPYGWLLSHGLDPLYDSDVALDPNGAGLTYLQEYQLEQSTVDLWKFDEGGQSLTTTSCTGFKDLGTLVNGLVWTPDPDGGAALLFNQASAQVDVASPTDGHLDFAAQHSFSITARFQTTAAGLARLAGKGAEAATAAPGYSLGINNGQLFACIGNGDGQASALTFLTTATYNDGQWHHVAATFDLASQQARLYVDGILQDVIVGAGSTGVSQGSWIDLSAATGLSASRPDKGFTIAAVDLGGSNSFTGTMDNVGLFSKALTAAEVAALAGNQLNSAPVVSVDSPLPATEFPELADIALDAQAYALKGTISKVAFFSGAVEIGEVSALPFTLTWPQVPVGTYAITARATDSRGASAMSAPVSIVVSADSDNDGLPDDWELRYFGNLDQTAAGSYLNDGVSNLTKYLLGLDPTKPIVSDTSMTATGLVIYTPLQ